MKNINFIIKCSLHDFNLTCLLWHFDTVRIVYIANKAYIWPCFTIIASITWTISNISFILIVAVRARKILLSHFIYSITTFSAEKWYIYSEEFFRLQWTKNDKLIFRQMIPCHVYIYFYGSTTSEGLSFNVWHRECHD